MSFFETFATRRSDLSAINLDLSLALLINNERIEMQWSDFLIFLQFLPSFALWEILYPPPKCVKNLLRFPKVEDAKSSISESSTMFLRIECA